MKRKRIKNVGSVDRISEFPEGIIHQIMSRLPSKEVARTCVLSKTWYHLKRNYPVLDFNLPCANEKENSDYLIKIRQAVYDTLHHFRSKKLALQTFSLHKVILGQPDLSSDLDNWIRLALENGVKELNLWGEVDVPVTASFFALPQPVFFSKTLVILELTSCVLDLPMSMFSSLRKLVLSECILKGAIVLKDTDCPVLEELSVQHCMGESFRSICISSLLRLHTVVVKTLNSADKLVKVEISSQSIQSLSFVPEFDEPWSDFNIHGCNRLKILYLMSETITDAELQSLLLNSPLLEELYLFSCRSLETIKISSPQLRTLQICYKFAESGCDLIEVSAPNLENFICKYIWWVGSSKFVRIKFADCCRRLKTLVLYEPLLVDEVFHNLISRFPQLENIWFIECHSLQGIKLPNLQLKGLHTVSCSGLKAVEVSSPQLCEFYYTNRKMPGFYVADDAVYASGVRSKRSSRRYCVLRLKEMLQSYVHVNDKYILNDIINVGFLPYKR